MCLNRNVSRDSQKLLTSHPILQSERLAFLQKDGSSNIYYGIIVFYPIGMHAHRMGVRVCGGGV